MSNWHKDKIAIVVLLGLLIVPLSVVAKVDRLARIDSLFAQANKDYEAKKYKDALNNYLTIENDGDIVIGSGYASKNYTLTFNGENITYSWDAASKTLTDRQAATGTLSNPITEISSGILSPCSEIAL